MMAIAVNGLETEGEAVVGLRLSRYSGRVQIGLGGTARNDATVSRITTTLGRATPVRVLRDSASCSAGPA